MFDKINYILEENKQFIDEGEEVIVIGFEDYYGNDIQAFVVDLKTKEILRDSEDEDLLCTDADIIDEFNDLEEKDWELADVAFDDVFKTKYTKLRMQCVKEMYINEAD